MFPESPALQPGLIALHGNRAEDLAEAVITWMGAHPLGPLEEEVVLVQSNGMGEWFKMEMARHLGVCAATRVELPARFLWRTYRQVLGAQAVPLSSPLDTLPMAWRLMRVLRDCCGAADPEGLFDGIRRYLGVDTADADRRFQLALQLADLYDQYQNHRTDWLLDWGEGRDVLRRLGGAPVPLPDDQRWQAVLWRQVLDTLSGVQRGFIRPALHQQVVDRLLAGQGVGRVARRVAVFGMGHLPSTTLTALAALAHHTQVLMAVPNPCRYDWGDIMDGRELLGSLRRRHPAKGGVALAQVDLKDMHQHAHPLLAAWGRQGRDFIRQLDAFDDAQATLVRFPQVRIDLFDTTEPGPQTPLLAQLQVHIRDLVPVSPRAPGTEPPAVPPDDASIAFHVAHSPVRELEVLHDRLLDLLAAETPDQSRLQPRDVVVMVPDIGAMAPAIRAVFGQYQRQDPRYIPFDIADLGARESSPLVSALEMLLRLPTERLGLSQLQDLFEVPAVAKRFGVDATQRPLLARWLAAAGVRWGLNEVHRAGLGLGVCGEQNTVWFGLQRLLMGYASGPVPASERADASLLWSGVEPVPEVGGLDAAVLGGLADAVRALTDWWSVSVVPTPPPVWVARARGLLQAFFDPLDDNDTLVLSALEAALKHWLEATEAAGLTENLPLAVFRRAWLGGLDTPRLERRFRAGGVTFCTLMPMRAIPFEMVCLLGMNGADYPRHSPQNGWDLMGRPGCSRPGDRSRQQDDRQLMLEALLSARRFLHISWSGRSVRDNTEQPPSVLVAQLRDHLEAVWGEGVVQACTTLHPLQPFSRRYFETSSALHTHTHEWRPLHAPAVTRPIPDRLSLEPLDLAAPIDWRRLLGFFRNPVRAFFRERLGVSFEDKRVVVADTELFALDPWTHHQWVQNLVERWPLPPQAAGLQDRLVADLDRLQRAGQLPMAVWGDQMRQGLGAELKSMATAWQALGTLWPTVGAAWPVRFEQQGFQVHGVLEPLFHNGGDQAWLCLAAHRVLDAKGRVRHEKLLEPWFRAVVAAASTGDVAQKLRGVWVARDAVVHVSALPPGVARDWLLQALAVWHEGMSTPLPLPLKTALKCAEGKDLAAQREVYEGADKGHPEAVDMYLSRCYPGFDSLLAEQVADGRSRFEDLAQRLYTPFLDWIHNHVQVEPHPQP